MKKNIKAVERKRVLEVFQQDLVEPVTLEGLGRMTSRKQRQWRMEATSVSTAVFQHDFTISSNYSDAILKAEKGSGQSLPRDEIPQHSESNFASQSDGTKSDVLVSLSNLLTKLGFEIPDSLDAFVHTAVRVEEPSTTIDCESISCMDISGPISIGTGLPDCVVTIVRRPSSRRALRSPQRSPLKWIDLNVDVDFPSGLWVDSSPYNELYPFPVHTSSRKSSRTFDCCRKYDSTRCSTFVFLCGDRTFKESIEERLQKIDKLRQVCLDGLLALKSEIYELAISYCRQRNFKKAISWVGKIIDNCSTSSEVMQTLLASSWVLLSYALWKLQKWKEAGFASQKSQKYLLISNYINQDLAEISFTIGSSIASRLEQDTNAESMQRQLVQMRLTKYGPRYEGTLDTLQSLAGTMRRRRQYSYCDQLLTLVEELGRTTFKSSDHLQIRVTISLSKLRLMQYRCRDAENLCRMALDQAEKVLGHDDLLTLNTEENLARVLESQSLYTESETIVRHNLEKRFKSGREYSLNTASSMRLLAKLLINTEKFEEAEMWLQKSLSIYQEKRLLVPGRTLICRVIIECYVKQKKFFEAISTGQRWLDELKKEGYSDGHVSKLEKWLQQARQNITGNSSTEVVAPEA